MTQRTITACSMHTGIEFVCFSHWLWGIICRTHSVHLHISEPTPGPSATQNKIMPGPSHAQSQKPKPQKHSSGTTRAGIMKILPFTCGIHPLKFFQIFILFFTEGAAPEKSTTHHNSKPTSSSSSPPQQISLSEGIDTGFHQKPPRHQPVHMRQAGQERLHPLCRNLHGLGKGTPLAPWFRMQCCLPSRGELTGREKCCSWIIFTNLSCYSTW